MKLSDIKYVVLINLLCVLFIYIFYLIYKKLQPMTAKRMRKDIQKLIKPISENPFKDDFCKMRAMLTAIDGFVSPEQTIAAVLISLKKKKLISFEITPKKPLKSFGEENQESIRFLTHESKALSGAEKLFFETLLSFTDESDILQKSELYQLARKNSSLIFQRLEQFTAEGNHALKGSGHTEPRKKRRFSMFSEKESVIFTQKGVRQAAQLKSYQAWLKAQGHLDISFWQDAVLLKAENIIDDKKMLDICKTLSQSLASGANSGRQSKSLEA